MRKLLLAAVAACSLFATSTEAPAESYTFASIGNWQVTFSKADPGETMDPFCSMDIALVWPDGSPGFLSFVSYTDDSVWIYAQSDRWDITPNKSYGSAVVTIGSQRWQATTKGASYSNDALNMYIGQRADFWAGLYYGKRLEIRFPQDRISISLNGSAAAMLKMEECWDILQPNKVDPYGGNASAKSNPFGDI